jgi:hypothetical protein
MGFRRLPAVLPILVSSLVVASASAIVAIDAAKANSARPAKPVQTANAVRAANTVQAGPAAQVSALAKSVSFGPVTLRVPASWPVISLSKHPRACPLLSVHAVYLGTPGPDPACPAGELAGKTESVQLMPVSAASPDTAAATRHAKVGGVSLLTNPDAAVTHTIIDIIPAAGVEVSLSYGRDPAIVRAIAASLQVAAGARARPQMTTVVPAPAPALARQGLYEGRGFDTCAAPSAATMRHWLASPYRAIGIYIGGINRGCAQASLTAGWLATIQREGWHYFPFYVGLQASCVEAYGDSPIVSSRAASEGAAAARDAAHQAHELGIPTGTPLIYDMEAYGSGCGKQVTTFLSAWDNQLHADGYLAGIYESFSNIGDLISARGKMVEPDVIHYADWDGKATTTSSYMPATLWTNHQRLHQYTGGTNLSFGGSTLNVDLDQLNVTLGGQVAPTPQPPPSPSPSPPSPLPPLPLFRVVVAMNSNGGAEWFARGANGTIRHAWQHPLGTTRWVPTVAVGHSPRNLVSNPAVAADQDGRLTLFAVNRAGLVIHAWQHQGAPDDWLWGGPAGTGKPGKLTGDPAAVAVPGGAVAVFVTRANGAVLTTRQLGPDDDTGWTSWTSLGGNCASSPVAFTSAGTVQVLCITRSGSLAVTAEASAGWQPWEPVDGLAGLTGVPSVTSVDGEGIVVARTRAGRVEMARQAGPTSGWLAVTGPPAGRKVAASPAVTSWPGGGVAVFAELSRDRLGYTVQATAGVSAWSGWRMLGGTAIGMPGVWVNSFGPPAVAVLDRKRKVAVANYARGAWSSWRDAGAGF